MHASGSLWRFVPRFRAIQVAAIGVIAVGGYVWFRTSAPVNVLLITLDTTRADRLGCYGYHSAKTPNLDMLPNRGVLFERTYAPAPMNSPSHAQPIIESCAAVAYRTSALLLSDPNS